MSIPNELRLSAHIPYAVRLPMMASPRNQQLRMQYRIRHIRGIPQRRIIGMIANIEPNVLIAVDMRETRRTDVVPAVLVDLVQVGCRRDSVVLPWWESPFAPLLRVVHLQLAGDERWAVLARDLV